LGAVDGIAVHDLPVIDVAAEPVISSGLET
jgi:hypothetical protein